MTTKDAHLFHNVRSTRNFLLAKTDIAPAGDCCPPTGYLETVTPSRDLLVCFETDSQMAVANALDNNCRRYQGLWGLLGVDLFGVVFPDKKTTFSRKAAKTIREQLSKEGFVTVSIGTAAYPMQSFEKGQVLDNACKALDHAAFFGSGSTVAFDDVSLNISGDKLFQFGDLKGAMGEFKMALALNGANTNARNSLGVCYSLIGDYELARAQFDAATRVEPAEFMALYNLGLICMMTDNRDPAIFYFKKAYRINPAVFEVALQAGRTLLDQGDVQQAEEYLKKAVELNPDASLSQRLWGDCLMALDRDTDAIDAFKTAIKLNPNDAGALSGLGYLYDARGENSEIASLYCEKSVELAPKEGRYFFRLGCIYRARNRLKSALDAFETAIALGHDAQEQILEIQGMEKTG